MEVLESPNSDCVGISVQLFFRRPNNLSCCVVANIVPGTILLPTGLLITGWAAQRRVFWLVPDVVSGLNCTLNGGSVSLQGIALVGVGITTAFQNIQTYVIDSFTMHAASGEIPVRLPSLVYALTYFPPSQLLPPLLSCARWLALVSRCSLRRCTTL